MSVDRGRVGEKIDEVEAEMRRVGLWREAPLEAEKYNFRQAFALDTMAFVEWLQFVFIPRVHEILAAGGELPAKSEVGAQAFREFVMYPAYDEALTERLLSLLKEFDRLVEGG
jgi:uncharacterized protein YqcC (DUF446 family)